MNVDKSSDRQEVQPGETVRYSITVRNNSNRTITSVVVEDTYPTSDFFVSNVGQNGVNNGRSIRWEVGSLARNESKTFTYSATINGRHGQTFHNSVVVTGRGMNQAGDQNEVRVIELLPQTGTFGRFFGGSTLTASTSSADAAGTGTLPFIIWTTILSIGLAGGGLMGRRMFF